jgi:hypothetical protein
MKRNSGSGHYGPRMQGECRRVRWRYIVWANGGWRRPEVAVRFIYQRQLPIKAETTLTLTLSNRFFVVSSASSAGRSAPLNTLISSCSTRDVYSESLGDFNQLLSSRIFSVRRRLTWSCCIVLELFANGMISIVALESPI